MTKEELLAKIRSAQLEPKLEALLVEMVESANEVSDDLLNIIIDLLDVAADIDKAEIEALDQEIDIYEDVELALEHMQAEFEAAVATGHADAYQQALQNVQAKIQELSQKVETAAPAASSAPTPEQQPPQDSTQNQNSS